MKTTNCLIAGVGGQGTVLASKLLAYAAMDAGAEVRTAETIGMAQRGGSVVSHVRIGGEVLSPLIPPGEADILIAFEPAEAVRALPYCARDCVPLVCRDAEQPVTASLKGGYDAEALIDVLRKKTGRVILLSKAELLPPGAERSLNVAMLGAAAAAGALPFGTDGLRKAVRALIREKYRDINLAALDAGAASVIQ